MLRLLIGIRNMTNAEAKESDITMNEIFDENGNYIYPTDIFLGKPNTAIGYIPLSEETDVIGYKLVDDDDKKVSKKLISAFVQGAISDDNEREKVLKYIEEISE